MSMYKVKLGEEIVEVDGLGGLVTLVREGRLGPEDPVFIPSTGRWHYARSVRQLREHFPAAAPAPASSSPSPSVSASAPTTDAARVPATPRTPAAPTRAPSPPASSSRPPSSLSPPAVRPASRERRPPERRARVEEDTPPPPRAAEVVRLKTGRWTPDGGGVEVPVFAYDVDAEPPRAFRMTVLASVSLIIGVGIYVYAVGGARVREKAALEHSGAGIATLVPAHPTPPPVIEPTPAKSRPGRAARNDASRGKHPASPPTRATPTPSRSTASFDVGRARAEVTGAQETAVSRPDQLGRAIRLDLTRLGVPVHEVAVMTGKGPRNAAIPFHLRVDYAPPAGTHASRLAHDRFVIAAMLGRRIGELRLNVQSIHMRTLSGGRPTDDVAVPVDLARRNFAGAGADELTALFHGR